MRRLRRGLALALVFVLLGVGGAYLWLRTSLPDFSGQVRLAGLGAAVEVIRDANAVPHIFAETLEDAYFALGFVHAQDRLWQMDMQRRLGAGRLAEILGEPALRLDRYMRTLGLYRLVEREFAHLAPEVQEAIRAYAAGVNAYLDSHSGAWPPEFYLLGYRPEPWNPADSLVWGKLMAVRLSTNWRSELLRARLAKRLSAEQIAALWPPYPDDAPVTLAGRSARRNASAGLSPTGSPRASSIEPVRRPHPDRPQARLAEGFGGASNQWVVDGRHTGTGKPILANDPHMELSAPIIWYLARVHAPGLDIAGATVPGVPFILLGHNQHIAWGFTTTYADTEDLFIERLDPDDPGRYLTPEGAEPLITREEIIRVRGNDDVVLTVRESRHGPIISDLLNTDDDFPGDGRVLALAAPYLRGDDRIAEAFYRLNHARGWDDFVAALSRFHAPQQNIVYADIQGNIGFYAAARVPLRKSGTGYTPAPGWTGDHDWIGFIPFERLPHSLNPASGRLVNANNKLVGDSYPYFISMEWGNPYRVRRIHELLDQTGPQTLATTASIQGDVVSPMARDLLPLLLDVEPRSPRARAAHALLRGWDGRMDRNRPEPLIFSAWLRALNRLIYADELKDMFDDYWSLRPLVLKGMLTRAPEWCDDVTTPATEGCEDRIAAALEEALDSLTDAYAGDMRAWRWGEAHYARFRHRLFDRIPLLGNLLSPRVAADGGSFTINKGESHIHDDQEPFAQIHGPGYRGIYNLANLSESLFMVASGQSGNPLSAHYRDFIERWRDLEYVRLAGRRQDIRDGALGVLELVPR